MLPQKELNLGILAHVDAGKTTLTERLLFDAGAIEHVGSVDAGTTQTDFLALERQRGITIRSAVASFAIGDLHVNLIDTPGHPDFIAEVERVLCVLDCAVLVVSAVEGVQPQTRVLMRALKRLEVPTLIFVNKTDRVGADVPRVRRELVHRLGISLGDSAEALAERDEQLLAAYVDGTLADRQLEEALVDQTRRGLVHPAYDGSAMTGAGVPALMTAIAQLLPAAAGDPDGQLDAAVFKIERAADGQKVAYARVFAGTIRVRDRLEFGKVTALSVFDRAGAVRRQEVSAGGVAKLWGLADVQVGDRLGGAADGAQRQFAPPTLEAVLVARDPGDAARLQDALAQLAEQDPLIAVRRNELDELSVSLYGEVQQEVIEATLADDYGLDVEFRDAKVLCIERPVGSGEAVEILNAETNPYSATVGLRIEPAPHETGIVFQLDVPVQRVPLYAYKRLDLFRDDMEHSVRRTLQEGLCGWQVTDCVITMTDSDYASADGPPSKRGPMSTPNDFRRLTPIVLMRALDEAGTAVCEPIVRVELEVPPAAVGAVLAALARLGATVDTPALRGDLALVETLLPAARANDLQRQLPGLTRGEGVLESTFAGYRRVAGEPPVRPRTTPSPLDVEAYLLAGTRVLRGARAT